MENSRAVLQKHLKGVDDDALEYFDSMISAGSLSDELIETLAPFIESYGLANSAEEAEEISKRIVEELSQLSLFGSSENSALEPQRLERTINLGAMADNHLSAEDKANLDKMWGFEDVRKKRNVVNTNSLAIGEVVATSARTERKAAREQTKWLEELEAQFVGEEDNNNVSTMMLPDYSGNSNEKDIHVHNFNITYGGSLLLESADLRLVYGRRYGLIGRNGVGKTTLLKHMACFDIEGFPRHHRVLHVKQEVRQPDMSSFTILSYVSLGKIV